MGLTIRDEEAGPPALADSSGDERLQAGDSDGVKKMYWLLKLWLLKLALLLDIY